MSKNTDKFDYQTICDKNTPKEKRKTMNIGDIWNNSVKCKRCNEIIRSTNVHDFVTCKCGAISIDGGSHYVKRCGDMTSYEELSEEFNDVNNKEQK